MILDRFLRWKRESWRRHRRRQIVTSIAHHTDRALNELVACHEDLREYRRLAGQFSNPLTSENIPTSVQVDMMYRGESALAAYEAEIERKR